MHHIVLKKNRHNQTHGFTLVEVLVAIAIFSFVATTAVGTLLVLIDANRKAQSIETAISNVTFALDSMSREIRTGTYYYCDDAVADVDGFKDSNADKDTKDCAGMSRGIVFFEGGESLTDGAGSNKIAYRIANDGIERRLGTTRKWERLTDPSVRILIYDSGFTVYGTDVSDDISPSVTIHIKGYAGDTEDSETDFNIQTTITQQVLDI